MKTHTNRRVALITGANRGIGLQTAKDLGHDGDILLLGVRDLPKGKAAAERLRQEDFEAEAVHLDVTDPVTRSSDRYFIFAGRLTACAQSPMDKGQISASSWE